MEDLNYALLCKYCFEVLETSFTTYSKKVIFPEEFQGKSYPLFVTSFIYLNTLTNTSQ